MPYTAANSIDLSTMGSNDLSDCLRPIATLNRGLLVFRRRRCSVACGQALDLGS